MTVFPHNELRYYFFGLRAGAANFITNGWALGGRKTLGKLTQPINAPSRFAEYFCFDRAIRPVVERSGNQPLAVLDVGSPKLFGLYLARTSTASVTLTDISGINLDEYMVMWRALQDRAQGSARFSMADARDLPFASKAFDVVYSMSVIEHVEGDHADIDAVREFQRVLKPGGLLVLSVPFGSRFEEQHRKGFAGAARKTGDTREYFFQRIYDEAAFKARILDQVPELERVSVTTVTRRNGWLTAFTGRLGENLRGALGFLNPVLSAATSTTTAGIDSMFPVRYGRLHTAADVYGDLILSGYKR